MTHIVDTKTESFTIEAAIARFGAWPLLRASLLSLLSRGARPRAFDPGTLSDHLRKDVGLGPAEPPPDPWRLMR